MAKQHYKDTISQKTRDKFSSLLAEDEELVLATGFAWTYLRQLFLVTLIIPGGIFILGGLAWAYFTNQNIGIGMLYGLLVSAIFALLKVLHAYHANRYLLTTRRVIIKKGLLAVKLTSALYDKVTHIEVDQGIVERFLLHYGTIIVNTAGMNKGEITLKFVSSPIELKNLLERLINREREQVGRSTGAVYTVEGEIIDSE